MRLWTKIMFGLGVVLLGLFLAGISPAGQSYLIGKPLEDHWERDDQYMGAALAPYVYCLVPSFLFFTGSVVTYSVERRRSRKSKR
jgi:hypothetical protein